MSPIFPSKKVRAFSNKARQKHTFRTIRKSFLVHPAGFEPATLRICPVTNFQVRVVGIEPTAFPM